MWNLDLKKIFDKGVELDKKILEKIEKKFNLSPYQSKCANAVLGFIIGAILLWLTPHLILLDYLL